jgi:hypothetical protein
MFFSGFFVWEEIVVKKQATFATTFIPTSRSVFGSKRRSFKSFFYGLRHLVTRSRDDTVHLAVCNLLARSYHKLPPLQCNWKFDKSGYAILTGVDCSSDVKQQPSAPQGYSDFFKVLIVGNDKYQQPDNLHSYTSGERRWSGTSKFAFAATGITGCMPLRNARAIVWRGTAHWLVRYFPSHDPMQKPGPFYFSKSTSHNSSWHTIDVDAETCRVSLTKIETLSGSDIIHSYDEAQLTIAADGKLSLFHMRKGGYQLEVWIRQEDGGPSRWLRASDIELNPPTRMSLLILGEKGGMLIVKNNHGDVYIVDLETGDMKKVMSFDTINRRQIVPFEMDWPTFFVSRLGNR